MELLDLGYGDERFRESVNEDLHCPICTNVLKQPVHCGPSEHYFCKSCITRHLENNTNCPCCKKELSVEKLHPPSRFVTNRLSKLTISCDNFDRGCPELIELENLGFHVKKCEFSLVMCSNDGCTSTMNRKDLAEHETDLCPFRKRKCDECVEMRKELEEMKTNLKEVKAQLLAMENVKEVLCPMPIGLKDDMKNLQDTMQRLNKPGVREDFIVMGGCEKPNLPTNSVELFSWSTKSWKTLKPMNKCRAKSSAVVYKDKIIVLGGITSPITDPSRFPTTDSIVITSLNGVTSDSTTWANFPATLPRKRSAHKCVVYGDRVFVVGGCDQKKGKSSDSIDEVQLIAPYSSKPLVHHMPCRRSYHGAELVNDKIVIAGGTPCGNMNECLDSVLEYDVNNKKLRALAPLPFAVTGFGTAVWGDKLVLIGGVDKNANRLDTVLMYDVKSGKSTRLPPMKYNREGCTAVVTGNVIVVMGGHNNTNEGTLKSVEYFSFERYSWNDLPPMNQQRSYASAVVKTT